MELAAILGALGSSAGLGYYLTRKQEKPLFKSFTRDTDFEDCIKIRNSFISVNLKDRTILDSFQSNDYTRTGENKGIDKNLNIQSYKCMENDKIEINCRCETKQKRSIDLLPRIKEILLKFNSSTLNPYALQKLEETLIQRTPEGNIILNNNISDQKKQDLLEDIYYYKKADQLIDQPQEETPEENWRNNPKNLAKVFKIVSDTKPVLIGQYENIPLKDIVEYSLFKEGINYLDLTRNQLPWLQDTTSEN